MNVQREPDWFKFSAAFLLPVKAWSLDSQVFSRRVFSVKSLAIAYKVIGEKILTGAVLACCFIVIKKEEVFLGSFPCQASVLAPLSVPVFCNVPFYMYGIKVAEPS